jgi:hypothetical protein
MSRIPFNLSHKLGDADVQVDIKKMDVIRHNCHPEHTIAIGLSRISSWSRVSSGG